jgi:hypothetical protein
LSGKERGRGLAELLQVEELGDVSTRRQRRSGQRRIVVPTLVPGHGSEGRADSAIPGCGGEGQADGTVPGCGGEG